MARRQKLLMLVCLWGLLDVLGPRVSSSAWATLPYVMEKIERGDDRLIPTVAGLTGSPAAQYCSADQCLQ